MAAIEANAASTIVSWKRQQMRKVVHILYWCIFIFTAKSSAFAKAGTIPP